MNIKRYTDPSTLDRVVTVRWSPDELRRLKLDEIDRQLLTECGRDDATVADVLLGLQTLAFRLEQQS